MLARRISGRLERRPAHQSQEPCEAEPAIRFGRFYRPENCRLDPHTVRDKSQPKSQKFRAFRQMAASPSNLTCGQFPSHFQFTGTQCHFILVTYPVVAGGVRDLKVTGWPQHVSAQPCGWPFTLWNCSPNVGNGGKLGSAPLNTCQATANRVPSDCRVCTPSLLHGNTLESLGEPGVSNARNTPTLRMTNLLNMGQQLTRNRNEVKAVHQHSGTSALVGAATFAVQALFTPSHAYGCNSLP